MRTLPALHGAGSRDNVPASTGRPTMSTIALALILLVALLHLYFLVLEMFLWTRPLGLKTFRNTPEKAQATRVLAANQGLYNGFLAAGLLYAAATGSREFALFFLACVAVAGAYGAWSVNKRIFFVQAVPALLALAAVCCL
jgi:putative membrane protein